MFIRNCEARLAICSFLIVNKKLLRPFGRGGEGWRPLILCARVDTQSMFSKDGKSERGWSWSRRSRECFLDSLDSFFGEEKKSGESCLMRIPRETTVGELKQKGDRCSLRHNGRMRYAATATHSSSLLPAAASPSLLFPCYVTTSHVSQ